VGDVYQAGTLSGNPLAVAAGLATLALLDEGAYIRLAKTTDALAQGLRTRPAIFRSASSSTTGLLTVFFAAPAPRDLREAQACDIAAYGHFCRELLARGVLRPPVAVRGVVSVPRAQRGARRANARGRTRRVCCRRGGVVKVLERLRQALLEEGEPLAQR